MKNENEMRRYNFLGVLIDCVTYQDLYDRVALWLNDKNTRSHHIAVINAFCVMMAFKDKKVADIYNKADIVGPDGMPFVYWMRLFMGQPCDQFDASSVLIKLIEKSKETGYTFYLYGGYPEVVRKMKENLLAKYPYLKIIGYQAPPFRLLTKEEEQAFCDEINRLKPDILCVSYGTPKQDYWIDEHINKIKGTVIIPSGAIFDFFGGRIKRAPRFITIMGLEWLFRLFSRDFKRLWYRYTVLNVVFLWNFFLQLCGIKKFRAQRVRRSG